MKLLLALCPLVAAPFFVSPSAPVQDDEALAEMMKEAERYTKPGPEHEFLERFATTLKRAGRSLSVYVIEVSHSMLRGTPASALLQ